MAQEQPPSLAALDAKVWQDRQQAESDLLKACEEAGFAAVRRRSDNWTETLKGPARIVFECYKGRECGSRAKGKRQRQVIRENCPWQGALVYHQGKRQPHIGQPGWRFTYVKDRRTHSHTMSSRASFIPANRRNHLSQEVCKEIEVQAAVSTHSAADVVAIIRKKYPDVDIDGKVVLNHLLKARKQRLRDLIAVRPVQPEEKTVTSAQPAQQQSDGAKPEPSHDEPPRPPPPPPRPRTSLPSITPEGRRRTANGLLPLLTAPAGGLRRSQRSGKSEWRR
ncbi:hypothetical protein F4779DRAFT_524618 [Xylariaceae sp. FL0662B]|nr:hypothetical protein F4779DRAFT_524618 [Xylariaceae sp. FL0662B]